MININLLPEMLRKKERMPLQQFLAICGMVLAVGLVLFMVTKYEFDIIPNLESKKTSLTRTKKDLTAQAEELKAINGEINKLTEYVDTVKGLYRNRVVWSKILADIKNIVNFEPEMSEYNSDMRYIWFSRLAGKGKQINISGFATASNQVVAMGMPERLLNGFRTYSPIDLPEKDEEAKIQEQLREEMARYELERRDDPSLPLQGEREVALRQRLEEIKNFKSGGIALQPFESLLVSDSLKLVNATWAGAPQPGRRTSFEELFPQQAWSFSINMELK